jgi:hypothetical protein
MEKYCNSMVVEGESVSPMTKIEGESVSPMTKMVKFCNIFNHHNG